MTEKVLLEAVVVMPATDDAILLARKMRHIGEGCFNGYGGGIEGDETPEDAAVRELSEESGLIAAKSDLRKIAVVDFHNMKSDGVVFRCRVHMFIVTAWKGMARATEEMADPTWFPRNNLPLDDMMLADRHWLPAALTAPSPLYAQAWYGPRQQTLLRPVVVSTLGVE